jgi:hypothetical protein
MTDTTVFNLPAAATLDGTELLYGIQGGADRKVTAGQVKAYAGGAIGSVNFARFGGVGDGNTDNAVAWMAFNTWAKAESAAGRAVLLEVAPGVYNFNHKNCQNYLMGIRKLHIRGVGAIFQNTYDRLTDPAGANSAYEWAWGPPAYPVLYGGLGPKINNTVFGDTALTLKTPADHAQFGQGDWVMVSSLDIQYYGFPPNSDIFEFTQVTAINTTTGVLTVSPPIRNEHRADYPDGGNPNPGGAARIWQLKNTDRALMWDIEHIYEGLEIRIAPNTDLSYLTAQGQSIRYLNCIVPGLSPSICERFEMIGGVTAGFNEPDKLVTTCLFDNVWLKNELRFQSSSIDHVTVRNCRVDGVLASGMAKNVLIENCDIRYFSEGVAGQPYGVGRRTTILGGRIRGMGPTGLPGAAITIDGTNISFANGTFALLKASANLAQWGIVPGTLVNLTAPVFGHSGDLGTGVVTRIYEDATKLYIETSLPYGSLPGWADGKVTFKLNGRFTALNVTGCRDVEKASAACALGKHPSEYHEMLILNPASNGGNDVPDKFGTLVRARFDVIQASSIAGALVRFGSSRMPLTATMAAGSDKQMEIAIDCMVKGSRDFTTTTLTGKTTNDYVKIMDMDYTNVINLTALPADRWCIGGFYYAFGIDAALYAAWQLPILRVRWEFDQGLWTQILLSETDASGTIITDLVGQL